MIYWPRGPETAGLPKFPAPDSADPRTGNTLGWVAPDRSRGTFRRYDCRKARLRLADQQVIYQPDRDTRDVEAFLGNPSRY